MTDKQSHSALTQQLTLPRTKVLWWAFGVSVLLCILLIGSLLLLDEKTRKTDAAGVIFMIPFIVCQLAAMVSLSAIVIRGIGKRKMAHQPAETRTTSLPSAHIPVDTSVSLPLVKRRSTMSFKCKLGLHQWDGFTTCANCGKPRAVQESPASVAVKNALFLETSRILTWVYGDKRGTDNTNLFIWKLAGDDRVSFAETLRDKMGIQEWAAIIKGDEDDYRRLAATGNPVAFDVLLGELLGTTNMERVENIVEALADVSDKRVRDILVLVPPMIRDPDSRARMQGYISGSDSARTKSTLRDTPRDSVPNTWDTLKKRLGTCISGDPVDDTIYPKVRIHTSYLDRGHADSALGRIPADVAGLLTPSNEGVSNQTGSPRYHVVHEGRLTGLQIKEYLAVVVAGGGEVSLVSFGTPAKERSQYGVAKFEVLGLERTPSMAEAADVCRSWLTEHPSVDGSNAPVAPGTAPTDIWSNEKGARPAYAIDNHGSDKVFRWDVVTQSGQQYLVLVVMTRPRL